MNSLRLWKGGWEQIIPNVDMNDMILDLNKLEKERFDKNGQKEKELHEEVLKIVKEDFGEEEYSKIRDMVLLACEMGEESGFVRGFKYAYLLFMECIRDVTQE